MKCVKLYYYASAEVSGMMVILDNKWVHKWNAWLYPVIPVRFRDHEYSLLAYSIIPAYLLIK